MTYNSKIKYLTLVNLTLWTLVCYLYGMRIYGMLCLFLIACGSPRLELNEFSDYVHKFEDYSTEYGRIDVSNLVIQFHDTTWFSPTTVGVCQSGGMVPTIFIDPVFWEEVPEEIREALVFHELGHCILHQQHRSDRKSIMSPYVITDFWHNTDYYMQELFLFGKSGYEPHMLPQSLVPDEEKCETRKMDDGTIITGTSD